MYTSNKLRRLRRRRALRRQRSLALILVVIFTVLVATVAFARSSAGIEGIDVVSVKITSGDTLWNIALEYKPDGTDVREFISRISEYNGIENANIICGQTIYIPL